MATYSQHCSLAVVCLTTMFVIVSSLNVLPAITPNSEDDNVPTQPSGAGSYLSGTKSESSDDGQAWKDGAEGLEGKTGASLPPDAQEDKGNNKCEPGAPYLAPSQSVAFVAHRINSFRVPIGDNPKIIDFESMKLNMGDDFNPNTGIFTCRVPGLYHFGYNMLPWYDGYSVSVYMEHNGEEVAWLWISGNTAFASGSQSTLLGLNEGDEVLLRAHELTRIRGGYDGRSSFHGHLIQAVTKSV